jgi:hypothetical protein
LKPVICASINRQLLTFQPLKCHDFLQFWDFHFDPTIKKNVKTLIINHFQKMVCFMLDLFQPQKDGGIHDIAEEFGVTKKE